MHRKIEELKQLRDNLMDKYDDEIIEQNEELLITPLRDFLDMYAQKLAKRHSLYWAVMNINNYKLKKEALVLDLFMCKKKELKKGYMVGALTISTYEKVLEQNGLKYDMNITENDKNRLIKLFNSKKQHTLKK